MARVGSRIQARDHNTVSMSSELETELRAPENRLRRESSSKPDELPVTKPMPEMPYRLLTSLTRFRRDSITSSQKAHVKPAEWTSHGDFNFLGDVAYQQEALWNLADGVCKVLNLIYLTQPRDIVFTHRSGKVVNDIVADLLHSVDLGVPPPRVHFIDTNEDHAKLYRLGEVGMAFNIRRKLHLAPKTKELLVVDEAIFGGNNTLRASRLLRHAFPGLRVVAVGACESLLASYGSGLRINPNDDDGPKVGLRDATRKDFHWGDKPLGAIPFPKPGDYEGLDEYGRESADAVRLLNRLLRYECRALADDIVSTMTFSPDLAPQAWPPERPMVFATNGLDRPTQVTPGIGD